MIRTTIFVLGLSVAHAQACLDQAKTELERALCQIKARDSGAGLPTLQEFRRNPSKIQYLLLKLPAQKNGIELPDPDRHQSNKTSKPSAKPETAAPKAGQSKARLSDGHSLNHCKILDGRLKCAERIFLLQTNRQAEHVGDVDLALAPMPKSPDIVTQRNYLFDSYRRYIEAMLAIGLAEVTFSYTKFHHVYTEVQSRGGDFPQRMEKMFSFLKQDKLTMATGRRLAQQFPEEIGACQKLSSDLIVCDNVIDNWVYLSAQ